MRLLHDRVLVQLAPQPERQTSGLIHAEAMPIPQSLGRVVAVGPKVRDIRVRDVVLFNLEAGDDISPGIDGLRTPHVIVREHEVELHLEAE